MTTAAGSEFDRVLQRLAVAERAEDAAWSLVLRARASYEGATAARDDAGAAQSYADFVVSLGAFGPTVTEVIRSRGELAQAEPSTAADVKSRGVR